MSESPIELRGKSGGVVFQGTQSPGGGAMPPEIAPILYSDFVDTGNGYRFAPLVTLAADDVLTLWGGGVSEAFNDSTAISSDWQLVDAGNIYGLTPFSGVSLDTVAAGGAVNLVSLGLDSGTSLPAQAPGVGGVFVATAPVVIGVSDGGGLAGDGTAGTLLVAYSVIRA